VPAAAVIPAPLAYVNAVAVKKLVVHWQHGHLFRKDVEKVDLFAYPYHRHPYRIYGHVIL